MDARTSFFQLFMGAVSPCFSFSSDAEFSVLFSTVSFLHDVQFSMGVSVSSWVSKFNGCAFPHCVSASFQ